MVREVRTLTVTNGVVSLVTGRIVVATLGTNIVVRISAGIVAIARVIPSVTARMPTASIAPITRTITNGSGVVTAIELVARSIVGTTVITNGRTLEVVADVADITIIPNPITSDTTTISYIARQVCTGRIVETTARSNRDGITRDKVSTWTP